MPVKTGIDIVHIPRIKRLLENEAAVNCMLHRSELANMEPQHIAGIIAAKEAFFKSLEMVPKWKEIEISSKQNGKPFISLGNRLLSHVQSVDLSISHDAEYAIAHVIVETKEKDGK